MDFKFLHDSVFCFRDVFSDDIGSHLKQSENLRAGTDKEKEESHKLLLELFKQVQ